jgi:hypothetical protein
LFQLTLILFQFKKVLSQTKVFPAKHCDSVTTQSGFVATRSDAAAEQKYFVTESKCFAAFNGQNLPPTAEIRQKHPGFGQTRAECRRHGWEW